MKLRRVEGSVWSVDDYSETVSMASMELLRGIVPDDREVLTGSSEAVCLTILLTLGYYPVGLNCGDPTGLVSIQYPDIGIKDDWFHLSLDTETGKWNWSVETTTGPFSVRLRGKRDERGMGKLRHDLVAMALGVNRTDVRLKDVFRGLEITEGYEHYTPDIHLKVGNTDFFIEIGTTLSTDPRGGLDMLRQKVGKYRLALEEVKLEDPCILVVIIVGKTFCVSNFHLDSDVIEKLIYYMHLGCRFEEVVEASGMQPLLGTVDTEQQLMAINLEKAVKNVEQHPTDAPWDFPLDITNRFISSLKEPANEELVHDYFSMSVASAIESMIESTSGSSSSDPRVDKYIEILINQESRNVQKPVVGFPLVELERSSKHNMKVIPRHITGPEADLPIIKLWNGAFEGYYNYDIDYERRTLSLEDEAYYLGREEQEQVEKAREEFKKTAHRSSVRGVLSEAERESLALDGLWGKRYRNSQAKQCKEVFAKMPFAWDTDTGDIDNFITNRSLLEESELSWSDSPSLELIRDSFLRLNQDTLVADWVETWTRTKLFQALEFISDAATEVAVSMKQNVRTHEVILKKLAYYNAYLLILPTKSSEHIFYSFYIPGSADATPLCAGPFRELIALERGGYYTEFCSMRADTLANPCTISSTFIGLASYWCYHYRIANFTPEHVLKNPSATTMLLFSILVRLENKAKTEEAITLSRYMYMEVFKGHSIVKPDPFRLISKFNTCPRSRLELFIIKRLISAFKIMLENLPYRVPPPEDYPDDAEEEIRNNDLWANLLNPYTGYPEQSASRVVNLFYIGYAVDKDKIAQTNSDYATIQKAIKKDREFIISEASKSNGCEDNFTTFPKEKQFSINALKHGVGLMAKDLERKHGKGFKTKMAELVINAMCEKMTEEVATLKASSKEECMPWDMLASAQDALLNKTQRTKVITALLENLDLFEHNVFRRFHDLVRLIEQSSMGILSDLFKKNQHGGLREIYVLNIRSRIIALFLETASRVLCKQFECETMTHPNNKIEVIESHKIAVATRASRTDRTYSEFHCSADKKNWNNNLVMPALSVALLMLLPKSFHGPIQRCLNMWNRRLLKIPDGVLKLLVSGTILSCETYKEMLEEYDNPRLESLPGEMPPIFAYPKSSFVRLSTGMMQGILHYTSSLAHVAFLYSSANVMRSFIRVKCPGSEHKISQMCSSDDSATIISIIHSPSGSDSELLRDRVWGEAICLALTKFCTFYCFTNSEKSNMGAPGHIEFNSEFVIGNTLAMPVLKWTLACFGVTESESFLLRYNTMYNLMSQANSAGLPARNTTMVQVAQGLLAYRLIGSSTSPFFDSYCRLIRSFPDPIYGYFVIDNIYVPGMLGFGYHHWANSRKEGMYKIKSKSVIDGTLGFTPEGGIMENFLLRHGRSQRYAQMLETIGDGMSIAELREFVNERSLSLYKTSTCTEDSQVKLIAKALLPGTAQSLSRGNPFLQALSSSVYCLHTYCFTRYESCLMGTERERSSSKSSLLGELYRRVNEPCIRESEYLANSEAAAFPNHNLFKTYMTILEPFKSSRVRRVRPMRYKKTTMFLPHATSHISIPLYDLVRDKWVGIRHKHSRKLAEKCWLEYVELMPWLTDNLDETLLASPFSDHMELHNFVSSAAKHHRKFTRVGPSIRSTFAESQVSLVARRTCQEGIVLSLDPKRVRDVRAMKNRRGAVSLALEIPISSARDDAISSIVRDYPIEDKELDCLRDQNRRTAILNVILAKKSGVPDEKVTELVMELGGGLVSSWTTEQSKKVVVESGRPRVTWEGKGRLLLCNREVMMMVEVEDKIIKRIKTSSLRETRKCFFALRAFLISQGLQPDAASQYANLYYTHKELSSDAPGTPIMEMYDPWFQRTPSLSHIKYEIRQGQGDIRLIQVNLGQEPSPVLIYKVLQHELDPMPQAESKDYMWNAWNKQSVLQSDSAIQFIRDAYERVKSEMDEGNPDSPAYKEAKRLKTFIANTLTARLRCKGYLSGASRFDTGAIQDAHDIASSEVAMVSDEVLNSVRSGANKLPQIELGVTTIVTNILQEQIIFHAREYQENASLEGLVEMEEPEEGTLTVPYMEVHMSLFSGTKTVVEYTSARLTNQYSILPLWDGLISAVNDINPKSWPVLSRGEGVAGIGIARQLIYFLTGKIVSTRERKLQLSVSEEIQYLSKKAVYDGPTARSSKTRSTRTAISKYQSIKAKLGDMLESDTELGSLPKSELIKRTLAYLDKVEQEESDLSSSTGSDVPVPVSPGIRMAAWVDEVQDYVPPLEPFKLTRATFDAVRSELTLDEMDMLYRIARHRFSGANWTESLGQCIFWSLQGPDTSDALKPLSALDGPTLFPLFLGKPDPRVSGHWVCALADPEKSVVLLFDGMNAGCSREIFERLSNLIPGLRRDQVVKYEIPYQPAQACGHVCMYAATAHLLRKAEVEYDRPGLEQWVLGCLYTGTIVDYCN